MKKINESVNSTADPIAVAPSITQADTNEYLLSDNDCTKNEERNIELVWWVKSLSILSCLLFARLLFDDSFSTPFTPPATFMLAFSLTLVTGSAVALYIEDGWRTLTEDWQYVVTFGLMGLIYVDWDVFVG